MEKKKQQLTNVNSRKKKKQQLTNVNTWEKEIEKRLFVDYITISDFVLLVRIFVVCICVGILFASAFITIQCKAHIRKSGGVKWILYRGQQKGTMLRSNFDSSFTLLFFFLFYNVSLTRFQLYARFLGLLFFFFYFFSRLYTMRWAKKKNIRFDVRFFNYICTQIRQIYTKFWSPPQKLKYIHKHNWWRQVVVWTRHKITNFTFECDAD